MASSITELRKFVAPEIIFGDGARRAVANYVATFGAERVLLVSDPGVVLAGWVEEVETDLAAQGIVCQRFTSVSPNPRAEEVMEGAMVYREMGAQAIVAIGGGSPMDCAKGIGIVVAHDGHIIDFEGVDTLRVPIPPLIFVPTTAGTSADISQFAIISDQQRRMKFSIVSKSVVPDVSLIDPQVTLTMSPFLTACTGVDALVHAIEAFVSTGSGPLTDAHALEAMRLINGHLVALVQAPHDL
ncbi:MAG: iron-containing alcohol dehydrogenase, partial [Halomonas sp.]|nr:iron-containing alcohol dehydrogenase [Halomonas sp.]